MRWKIDRNIPKQKVKRKYADDVQLLYFALALVSRFYQYLNKLIQYLT